MEFIFNDGIEELVKVFFEKKEEKLDNKDANIGTSINDLYELDKLINSSKINSRREARKYLSAELSLSYLGVMTLGILCLSINSEKKDIGTYNDDLESENNYNIVVQNLLTKLTNHALSVINLIELGTDSSAQVLMRSVYELSSLILVLLRDKEKMKLYSKKVDRKTEREIWRNNFNNTHLINSMISLEKELGFDEKILKKIKKFRNTIWGDYSQSSHNAFVASMFSKNNEMINHNLFGKFSFDSKVVLEDLNFILFYSIGTLKLIIDKYHSSTICLDKQFYNFFDHLRDCYSTTYINMTIINEMINKIEDK